MLQERITIEESKIIFGNATNKKAYLKRLFEHLERNDRVAQKSADMDEQIIDTWDYTLSKDILRTMFSQSEKYAYCQSCKERIDQAIAEWNDLGLGEFRWPFSAMSFDQHIHSINRNESMDNREKDALVAREVIQFRRIKEINALRNDYIEYLIFDNENIIPTFGNQRGVDFYINGNPYDQKVSKSVGDAFIQAYGETYRTVAIEHPELVAKSLYESQDEERFGDEPRLFVVYLDSDIDSESIKNQIRTINFTQPLEIEFDYTHSNNTTIRHRTQCFVILLHNLLHN